MKQIKLNLGCGSVTPEGWLNVDYAVGAWCVKIPFFPLINKKIRLFHMNWNPNIMRQDLRKRFPWSTNSVDCIYCSHTLEHFSKSEGQRFLKECCRVLKLNGIIRILVPDLKVFVDDYIAGQIAAEDFIEKIGCCYGDKRLSAFISFPHKCMYDGEALLRVVKNADFICQIKKPFESDIQDIEIIESPSGRAENSIIVEGKRT